MSLLSDARLESLQSRFTSVHDLTPLRSLDAAEIKFEHVRHTLQSFHLVLD